MNTAQHSFICEKCGETLPELFWQFADKDWPHGKQLPTSENGIIPFCSGKIIRRTITLTEFKTGMNQCHTLADLLAFIQANWPTVTGTQAELHEAALAKEAKQQQLTEDRTEIGALL